MSPRQTPTEYFLQLLMFVSEKKESGQMTAPEFRATVASMIQILAYGQLSMDSSTTETYAEQPIRTGTLLLSDAVLVQRLESVVTTTHPKWIAEMQSVGLSTSPTTTLKR